MSLHNRRSFALPKHSIQIEIKAGILIIYKMFSAVLTVVLVLTEDTKRKNFPSGLRKSAVAPGHIHNYHCCSQNDLTIVFCLRYSEQ